jgi:hypothetical protein
MSDVVEKRAVWAPTFEELWLQTSEKLPPVRRWQIALGRSALPPSVKAVGHALSTFMDSEGVAYPALHGIRERSGFDKATVCRALTILEREGWIVRRRSRGGPKRTTRYAIPELSQGETVRSETVAHGAETVAQDDPQLSHGATGSVPRSKPLEIRNAFDEEERCAFPGCGKARPAGGWTFTHKGRICPTHATVRNRRGQSVANPDYERWAEQ